MRVGPLVKPGLARGENGVSRVLVRQHLKGDGLHALPVSGKITPALPSSRDVRTHERSRDNRRIHGSTSVEMS